MIYTRVDLFDTIVDGLKDDEGYTVIARHKGEEYIDLFRYETKEELDKDFSVEKVRMGTLVMPRLINSGLAVINGVPYSLDFNEIYIVINGELQD